MPIAAEYVAKSEKTICTSDSLNHLLLLETVSWIGLSIYFLAVANAKVRRGSFEPDVLFYGHIAGLDSFAIGLKVVQKLKDDRVIEDFINQRYNSYSSGIGQKIISGETSLKELENYALDLENIQNTSGRTELLKSTINQYLLTVHSEKVNA